MTKNSFTLDGQSTQHFGVGISGYQVYNSSERDVETFHIPHRNGDLISDNKCFMNRRIVYNAWLAHTFKTDFDDFRDFLMAHSDRYYWLEDTYHPNHKYLARITGALEPSVKIMHRVGEFDVVFDAKPQRYRKDGLVWMSAGTITNPTRHECYPLLEISGTGTVTVNDKTIKVSAGATGKILFDCETMNAWTETDEANVLANKYIETVLEQIVLKSGSNLVSASGCTVRIQPRWFDL